MVLEITNDTYEKEVKQSDIPIIVDFWAGWCGPCKMMGPVFEEISEDYEGKLKFAKVNVEKEQEVAGQAGVMGIPCLIVFKDGKEFDRIVGYSPKEQLKEKIDAILEKI